VFIVEKVSGNRIRPADKEYKDFWTYKLEGGLLPPWLIRASKGKKDFWRPYDADVERDGHTGMTLEGAEKPEHGESTGTKGASQEVRDGSSSEEGGDRGEKMKA
jgi:adenine/guanine/hypoxanthine permease